jgi:hypothetical protein
VTKKAGNPPVFSSRPAATKTLSRFRCRTFGVIDTARGNSRGEWSLTGVERRLSRGGWSLTEVERKVSRGEWSFTGGECRLSRGE